MNTTRTSLTAGMALLVLTTIAIGGTSSAAFAQAASPAPGVTAGLSSATIKALQEALNKQDIAVKVDGVLDDATREAVKKYQSQHHLPVTGEPDKATLDKLGVAIQPGAMLPAGQAPTGSGMMQPGMMSPGHGMMEKGSGAMPGSGMPKQ